MRDRWGREKMERWEALVEWESGGFEDIPTANLLELLEELRAEICKRREHDTNNST